MVPVFQRSLMVRWVDGGPIELFLVPAVVCCYPVCGMMHINEPIRLNGKSTHVAVAGFLSRYLSGPLPYV